MDDALARPSAVSGTAPAAARAISPGSPDAVARALSSARLLGWGIRLGFLLLAGGLVLAFATDWSRWVGAMADQTTDDATLQADLTPLAAKVAGYVRAVPVRDYQRVHAGEVLVEIADADYLAQLAQAEANVAAAEAALSNLQSQKALQAANIRAAEAVVAVAAAGVVRTRLEARRQRSLLAGGVAGTRQLVE